MPTTTIKNASDIAPVLARMDKIPENAVRKLTQAMHQSVMQLERRVSENTPVGVGNSPTGHLRASIFSEVATGAGPDIRGIVGTPAEYAEAVEYGSRPHWPPKGALADWVHFKLGVPLEDVPSVEFLVRRRISIYGTPAAEMFQKGWAQAEPDIRRYFELAAADVTPDN